MLSRFPRGATTGNEIPFHEVSVTGPAGVSLSHSRQSGLCLLDVKEKHKTSHRRTQTHAHAHMETRTHTHTVHSNKAKPFCSEDTVQIGCATVGSWAGRSD